MVFLKKTENFFFRQNQMLPFIKYLKINLLLIFFAFLWNYLALKIDKKNLKNF
ncbi:MAG: hypothetical protein KatS3mg031_1151 [Chitinophagales bacterium]|nr:MAG: hypothetical protein KatS3mg031_1151 [Chitinophagales bacterium]